MATKTKTVIPQEGFYFDEAKHYYYMNGAKMTGVTTILGIIAKPQLIPWAARMATEYISENAPKEMVEKEVWTGNYLVNAETLELARKSHAQKKDKAADIGTLAHAWIEKWIKADMTEGEKPQTETALAIITDNFLKWVEEAKPKFLESEKKVYSVPHFYAGTLDFVAEIGGKKYLGDIKTGSGIYKDMFLQTAGYQIALEEQEPGTNIEGHIIVNPTKDGKLNVEEHFDFEATKEGFLSALKLYRLFNQQL